MHRERFGSNLDLVIRTMQMASSKYIFLFELMLMPVICIAAPAAGALANESGCPSRVEVDVKLVSGEPGMANSSRRASLPFIGMDVSVKYSDEDALTAMRPSTGERPGGVEVLQHWYMATSKVQATHLFCVYGQDRLVVINRILKKPFKQCWVKKDLTHPLNAPIGYCE